VPSVLRYFDAAVVTLVVVLFEVVWLFLFDFRFVVLFFLLSLLVSSCGDTYLLYTIIALWPPLEIVRCLEVVSIDVSFWSLVSHVPVVVVPCKLWCFFYFVPPRCCSFFLRLMPSTRVDRCVVRLFSPTLWHWLEFERIIVSVVLDLQLGTLAIAMALSLLCLWARASLCVFFRSVLSSFVLDTGYNTMD